MPNPILMPQVGQDLTEGKLVEWKVKVGDQVAKGDIVAVVESEKASFEVEAFEAGTVLELLYREGDTTQVLSPLLYLGAPGEAPPANGREANGEAAVAASDVTPDVPPARQAAAGRVRSSPLARRLARQGGIDLGALTGSGPKGSIVRRDVVAALAKAPPSQEAAPPPAAPVARAPEPPPAAGDDRDVPFDRMRQVIADRLLLSKQTIPHFYLRAEADVTDLMIRRKAHNEISGEKISVNDILVKVAALILREFPQLNAHVAQDRVILKGEINIGVAVSVENGLMVPVVGATDGRPLAEIAQLLRDYAAAARRGVTKSAAVGTFSVSNLGMYGVEVLPIINPPEAAILGVGPIRRQVREHRGGIHLREILALSLAVDHRAVDGAYGARFLSRFVERLEDYRLDD